MRPITVNTWIMYFQPTYCQVYLCCCPFTENFQNHKLSQEIPLHQWPQSPLCITGCQALSKVLGLQWWAELRASGLPGAPSLATASHSQSDPLTEIIFLVLEVLRSALPLAAHDVWAHTTFRGPGVFKSKMELIGLPWCSSGKESACQCKKHRFNPWSGRIPYTVEHLSPVSQLLSPHALEQQENPPQWEALPPQRSSLHSPQLEKARVQ